jgi:hypothetical protein
MKNKKNDIEINISEDVKDADLCFNDSINEKKSKKSKKKLLISIICIVAFIALLAITIEIIEYVNNKKTFEPIEIDYDFYPADYDENIFEDEKYLELIKDGYIRVCNSSTGVTSGVDLNKTDKYSPEVQFMLGYIQDIIDGNHESYNSRFSEEYYTKQKPFERFTMQKVYDVLITQKDVETVTDKKTESNYTKYLIVLEYKIYENNGTFRRDIGTGSRKQYFTITDKNGSLLIDSINIEKISK